VSGNLTADDFDFIFGASDMENSSINNATGTLLEVEGLSTYFFTHSGVVKSVDNIDFTLQHGEVLGIVGESGCGKTVTSLSIMRLIDHPGRIVSGKIKFDGHDLLTLSDTEMGQLRGNQISMIFQQPHSYLNPIFKVGSQIEEVLHLHTDLDRQACQSRVVDLLRKVGIPDPEKRSEAYPHELSGGMAQRVMIAMALACQSKLLIADEPTTALDVTIQAQILDLIRMLITETKTSVILITHDLGIVAQMAHRVAVMYAGRIVEEADTKTLLTNPKHPYTQGLIGSLPILGQVKEKLEVIPGIVPELINLPKGCKFEQRCAARIQHTVANCSDIEPTLSTINPGHKVRCWLYQNGTQTATRKDDHQNIQSVVVNNQILPTDEVVREESDLIKVHEYSKEIATTKPRILLQVNHLEKHYPVQSGMLLLKKEWVHAVNDVSFTINESETLGLVGESGCGKTTLGHLIIRQIPATQGSVYFDDQDVFSASKAELKSLRRKMQYIFQDPVSSLNPRMRIGDSVAEGLVIHGYKDKEERDQIVGDTLHRVGIEKSCINRFPFEFSGGQLQRIGIARALVLQPKFIICDEPISALDVSIRSQVLNLLHDLQHEFSLTYLFIAHDLSVIEHISNRVAVMYLGKIVELADRHELFSAPLHPYTQALIMAIPNPIPTTDRRTSFALKGDVPSPLNLPSGCAFKSRCSKLSNQCRDGTPELREVKPGHWCACCL
jgi:peptide/nickel transport system ATP-binding protein